MCFKNIFFGVKVFPLWPAACLLFHYSWRLRYGNSLEPVLQVEDVICIIMLNYDIMICLLGLMTFKEKFYGHFSLPRQWKLLHGCQFQMKNHSPSLTLFTQRIFTQILLQNPHILHVKIHVDSAWNSCPIISNGNLGQKKKCWHCFFFMFFPPVFIIH